MTRILQIDASARPGIRGQVPHGSHTRALTHRFVSQWQAADAAQGTHSTVQYRDVGANPPAAITANWVRAAFMPRDARSPELADSLRDSDALVAELRAADVLVLGVPMYNFGPPAGFKAWIDNVVRVGETFDFDPQQADPYTPLLADKPRAVVFLTSRGASGMNEGGPQAAFNHLDGAMQTALGLLGLTDWHTVAIEHDEHGGEALAQSVRQAMANVDAWAARLHAACAARHEERCAA